MCDAVAVVIMARSIIKHAKCGHISVSLQVHVLVLQWELSSPRFFAFVQIFRMRNRGPSELAV